MRKIIKGVAAAAALAGSATAVSAQQGPWTGLYLGAQAGYGTAKPDDGSSSDSIKGFMGGLYGGYNFQFGQMVAGLEGDYSFSRASKTWSERIGTVTWTDKIEIDNIWSIRARLGFLVMPNAMLYGTIGYGSFDAKGTTTSTAGFSASDTGSLRGLVLGGGVEMAFTRNIYGRVEGLYTMGQGSGNFSEAEANLTQIRAGLSYKF